MPASVKTIAARAFYDCAQLRSVELNEGLEVLGRRECMGDDTLGSNVFAKSAIESIKFPSTLRVIGVSCFAQCTRLRRVEFSEGLERIDEDAFQETAIESVLLPSSLRKLGQGAFSWCDNLKSAVVNEGLEVLGTDRQFCDAHQYSGVFEGSTLQSIQLPSTLKRIVRDAFGDCENLTEVHLPDGLEVIEKSAFRNSGIKEIELPRALKEVGERALWSDGLKTVWVDDGCVANIKQSVKSQTEILPLSARNGGQSTGAE